VWSLLEPQKLFWLALLFIVFRGGMTLWRNPAPTSRSPFDMVWTDSGRLSRFFWAWAALTVAFATALPALAMAGLLVYHCVVRLHAL
jgi:hypothetical protein